MSPPDLIKAIRKGSLPEVRAALAAGAQVEPNDGEGAPGLALGIACFMGHADIVHELVRHGGKVNIADNREPTSPLSMAIRGGRTEVVRLLVELGAVVPAGMTTGLSEQELTVAQWKSGRFDATAATPARREHAAELPVVEEIVMLRALGTDTMTLDAEAIRIGMEAEAKKRRG